jgi:hypothetical protein
MGQSRLLPAALIALRRRLRHLVEPGDVLANDETPRPSRFL